MASSVFMLADTFTRIQRLEYNPKYSRLAKIHKYWARKPWYVIERYVSQYSRERNLVVDPFCGSGLIGLEAILKNRDFIGYDLNPFAAFLAENTLCIDFDPAEFEREFRSITRDLKKSIMSLYSIGDRFLLYAIVGPKNGKPYNAVVCDFDFHNRESLQLSTDALSPEVLFPTGLQYPDKPFPQRFYKDRFSYKGVKNVSDMFSRRNLLALALLFDRIRCSPSRHKELFLLAFTNTLLHVSKLKAENVRPLSVNNFWIPDDHIEENVWWRFSDRVKNVCIAKSSLLDRFSASCIGSLGTYRILNKSSLRMTEISDSTVDYVITDPPYGDAIQYSELSYIWNCWLGRDFNTRDEVIINPVQSKGMEEYGTQMSQFIGEVSRILKPGRSLTLCFHNKDPRIWIELAKLLRDADMRLVNISSYDTFGSPYNKSWARFSPKSDLYVTLRESPASTHTSTAKVLDVQQIVEHVCSHPLPRRGSDFDLDRAYDLFVAAMISEILNGGTIADVNKLSIRAVVGMFQSVIKDGNLQGPIL